MLGSLLIYGRVARIVRIGRLFGGHRPLSAQRPRRQSVAAAFATGLLACFAASTGFAQTPTALEPGIDQILVVGGTRGTGLEIVKLLKSRGRNLTVMARPTSDIAALEALGVPVIRGDALNADQARSALVPGRYSTVISTLGARTKEPVRPDFQGNRNLIDAAKAANVPRFLMVTVIGAGNSSESPPVVAKWFLKDVIELKSQAEDYLKASGLEFTIIRPGGLLDKPPSGKAVLSEDPDTFSWIARADLALLVADALDDRKTIGRTYSAFDPTRERFWAMWSD